MRTLLQFLLYTVCTVLFLAALTCAIIFNSPTAYVLFWDYHDQFCRQKWIHDLENFGFEYAFSFLIAMCAVTFPFFRYLESLGVSAWCIEMGLYMYATVFGGYLVIDSWRRGFWGGVFDEGTGEKSE